jgi:GTP-binding protein
MVSMVDGKALAYALYTLQDRGKLIIDHGTEVYEGMLVGIHSRANDLVVNPTKGKKLDNMRASGNDENIVLTPPVKFTLEQAIEFLDSDELVEVTPTFIRLRKKLLKENERKRSSKK